MPARRDRRRAKSSAQLARRGPRRSILKRFLIVCEGEKTEPNYLLELVKDLALTTADVRIFGAECGSDPVSVVEFAIQCFEEDSDFDYILCVIDKDSHTNLEPAERLIAEYNLPEGKVFEKIISVPCFEYWILLHFEYTTSPFAAARNKSICDTVIQRIRRKHLPDYKKGNKETFKKLKSRLNVAIGRSIQSLAAARASGSDNPSTNFHQLIYYMQEAIEASNNGDVEQAE